MKSKRHIKLYEEFREDTAFYTEEIFKKIESEIDNWFTEGSLSFEDDIQKDYVEKMTKGLNPYMTFKYETEELFYESFIYVTLEEIIDYDEEANDEYSQLDLKIVTKVYDIQDTEFISQTEKILKLGELTEDIYLEMISKLDEEVTKKLAKKEEDVNRGE